MYLLSSSGDKTVRVWDLFGHRLLSTIATPSVISSVRFVDLVDLFELIH